VSVLGMLAEAGVVLVKAEKQTRAEADTELKAHRDSVWAEVSSLLDGLAGEGADPPGPAAGEAQAGDAGAADPGSAPAGGLDAPQLDWGKFVPE
jgi:hypothetical protein